MDGGSPLDPQELAAIRAAIQESSDGSFTPPPIDEEVHPLALIADDRAAQQARPASTKIATRWARLISRPLRHLIGFEPEIHVMPADTIDGASLRDDMLTMWHETVSPDGRPGSALVGVRGSMIEALAARLLGGGKEEAMEDRAPSATALRLFSPVGRMLADGLRDAWAQEQQCEVATLRDPVRIELAERALTDADVVIKVGLALRGEVTGNLVCVAKPETFVAPPTPVEAVPAPPGAIEDALGAVEVELRVAFGSARLTMHQLENLAVGSVIPLGQFIDDPLEIECAGVVKGHGRAVVHRGVLGVEVVDPAVGRRNAA